MSVYQTQIIQVVADTSSKANVLDLATAAEPEAWWARDLSVHVCVFADAGVTLLDVSDISSVTMSLKDPASLDGEPLVQKTVTAFDNTATLSTWQAGTQQHFVVNFTGDDLSFALGGGIPGQYLVHFAIVAITNGGQTGTLCVGTLNLIDDGGNVGGGGSGGGSVNFITVTAAEALISAMGYAYSVIALNAAGTTALQGGGWVSARAPVTVAASSGPYQANLTISPASPVAGALLRLPIDFAASTNGTVNIYDTSTGGTLLATISNPDATQARSWLGLFGYDGTHWHKEGGAWQ